MKMNYKSALNQAGAYLTAGIVATSCNPAVPSIDSLDINYKPLAKTVHIHDYASKLMNEAKWNEEEGMFFSGDRNWEKAAPNLKAALDKYSEIIRRFPGTSYAKEAEKALSDFYTDPVLWESHDGDTIMLGKNAIYVLNVWSPEYNDVKKNFDCEVKYEKFGPNGENLGEAKVDLVGRDFTPADLMGK
jgi:hypothetical protein